MHSWKITCSYYNVKISFCLIYYKELSNLQNNHIYSASNKKETPTARNS